jgi:hypothetical protein
VGERINQHRFKVTLVNFSNKPQLHDPLAVAYESSALDVRVFCPDGKQSGTIDSRLGRRNPFTIQNKLPPGRVSSIDFGFASFGYSRLAGPGRYRVETTIDLDGKVVTAPQVEFDVLPGKAEGVLRSHPVPLSGWQAKLPPGEQARPFVQQITIGTRTLLVYRRYYGSKHAAEFPPEVRHIAEIEGTFRLAELPGKCEMAVEGTYGDRGALTITYKTSATAAPAKLVVNSISGSPWTEEDERSLQERMKNAKP